VSGLGRQGAAPSVTMASGRSITWLLELRAAQRAGHPFVIWEPFDGLAEEWSYARFAAAVRAVAGGLAGRGVGPGDRLLLHMDNCPEFLLAWFACARIGAVAVCTNTRSSSEELAYFADHSGAAAALTQPHLAEVLAAAVPRLSWVAVTEPAGEATGGAGGGEESFARLLGAEPHEGGSPPGPSWPAWIQYTSGTTSRPKAVVLTHANALWGARMGAVNQGLSADDVHLVHLPLFHINALSYSTLATLWAGGSIVLVPRFSASRFWDVSIRRGATWASMIPFCVNALASFEVPDDHRYRLWGNGFSSPPQDALFGVRTIGWYGMTETVTHPVIDDVDSPGHPLGMGRPAPGYDIAVLGEDGSPAAVGETGDLYVRGVPGLSLFAQYLHDEEATRSTVDEDGWLRTGDRATTHEDGFLSFADRVKDVLKVGGENVSASEVEWVVMAVPGVSEVAVVGAPHPMLDEVPVAFVIPDGDRPGLDAEVLRACRARLAGFKVPAEVRIVAELPRSTLNKIAKAELRGRLRAEAPRAGDAGGAYDR